MIEGQGATLALHNFDPNAAPGSAGAYPTQLFHFVDVDGMTVRDLTVEMTREPYSSGVVTQKSAAGDLVQLQMDQAYPDLASGFQIQRIDDIHSSTGELESQDFTVQLSPGSYSTVVSPAPQPVVTLVTTPSSSEWFKQRMANVVIGERLLMMHSKYRTHFLAALGGSDLSVHNVKLHDMPGMGALATNVHNVSIDRFDLIPQHGRLMSITADGVHLKDCTGAVKLRDSRMERMGDDGLNVHSKYVQVTSVTQLASGRTEVGLAIFNEYWNMDWQVGDLLEFARADLTPYRRIQLAAFTDTSPGTNPETFLAEFDTDPGFKEGDLVHNGSNAPDTVLVEGCQIIGNIAHGVVVKADWSMVKDCYFHKNTGPGLKIEADATDYYEAEGVQHAMVVNCDFVDCNRFSWDELGALSIFARYRRNGVRTIAPSGVHDQIFIVGNRFTDLDNATSNDRAAVWITSSGTVRVDNNTFHNIAASMNLVRAEKTDLVAMNNGNCAIGFTGTKVTAFDAAVVEPTIG